MKKLLLLSIIAMLSLFSEVTVSSKENVEHEQIPPQELERIEKGFRTSINNAFSKLTSSKENERRLAGITLRRLHLKNEDMNYLVSEAEVQILTKQIESEKKLAAQVAEVSALSEVSHFLENKSLEPLVSDLLKKLQTDKYDREVILEAQYQTHLLKNSDEAKDYVVFEKMGLKKSDFVKTNTIFGHAVWDFAELDYNALTAKRDVVTAALKKLLVQKTDIVVLLEALDVVSTIKSSATLVLPEVTKLADHEFWRIRSLSVEILFQAGQLSLITADTKKKLMSDRITEVQDKVK